MFGNFMFPDGSKPKYESINKLQSFFLDWFRKEREKVLLTFPVVTVCMKTKDDGSSPEHDTFAYNIADEMSQGNSFFIYQSKSIDSLASCCRLRNQIDTKEFSFLDFSK
jgi:ribonucleoside-triphosphate reductase